MDGRLHERSRHTAYTQCHTRTDINIDVRMQFKYSNTQIDASTCTFTYRKVYAYTYTCHCTSLHVVSQTMLTRMTIWRFAARNDSVATGVHDKI